MKENDFFFMSAMNTMSAVMTRRKIHEPIRQRMIEIFENGLIENKELAKQMREMLSKRQLKYWYEKEGE